MENLVKQIEIGLAIYALIYLAAYLVQAVLSIAAINKYFLYTDFFNKNILIRSNNSRGISIIAPAYNEGKTIVSNILSLLSQEYPKYEIIIVNDGSSDNTMEQLIDQFELVKFDHETTAEIKTAPIFGYYRSKNPVYYKLLVVDKASIRSKSDALNAGINAARHDLIVCVDVDCILRKDALATLIKPFLTEPDKVIATGAAIRLSNSSEFKQGSIVASKYPKNWLARFQELEYIRSFRFGRMALSKLNGLLLVSGALGMFDKKKVIEVGGYHINFLGEDLELITRIRKQLHTKKQEFKIVYLPESLCWTEGPSDLKTFINQRVRWARGLAQNLLQHRTMFFNPKYGKTGMLVFPYFLFFEFALPIIELLGLIVILLDYFFFGLDVYFLFLVSVTAYLVYTFFSLISIYIDQLIYKQFDGIKDMIAVIGMILIEPFVYHPLLIYTCLKGYFNFFLNKEKKWGVMERTGFNESTVS